MGLDIEFEVCDMRKLSFKDKFDAVTYFFTSINYNVTNENMESTLRGVYESLKEGGIFIANFPNSFKAEKWLKGIPTIWRIDHKDFHILILDSVQMNNVFGMINWNRTIVVSKK